MHAWQQHGMMGKSSKSWMKSIIKFHNNVYNIELNNNATVSQSMDRNYYVSKITQLIHSGFEAIEDSNWQFEAHGFVYSDVITLPSNLWACSVTLPV